MASRNDIVLDLRAGFSPEDIAVRRQTNIVWIEIVAGKRIPECACIRRARRQRRLGREPDRTCERLAA